MLVFVLDKHRSVETNMNLKDHSGLTPEMLAVYEHLPGMYLILAADLKMITASESYLRITGKTKDEITGINLFNVFPLDPSAGIAESLEIVKKTKQPHQIPTIRFDTPSLIHPQQMVEHYWYTLHTPVLNSEGEIAYIIHFTQDVTELVATRKDFIKNEEEIFILNDNLARKNEELIAANQQLYDTQNRLQHLNMELELRVSERTQELKEARAESEQQRDRLKRFFLQSPAGICVLDGPNFVFELVNKRYQELFPGRNLVGKPLLQAVPEVENSPIYDILTTVYRTGKTYEGKRLLIRCSGR